MWEELESEFYELPMSSLFKIIDDAEVHGFIFKVEDSKIYFKYLEEDDEI